MLVLGKLQLNLVDSKHNTNICSVYYESIALGNKATTYNKVCHVKS